MSEIIPSDQHVGIEIREVGEGIGWAFFPKQDHLLNYISNVHATAIFGVAETASGCSMSGPFAQFMLSVRPVAASARIATKSCNSMCVCACKELFRRSVQKTRSL